MLLGWLVSRACAVVCHHAGQHTRRCTGAAAPTCRAPGTLDSVRRHARVAARRATAVATATGAPARRVASASAPGRTRRRSTAAAGCADRGASTWPSAELGHAVTPGERQATSRCHRPWTSSGGPHELGELPTVADSHRRTLGSARGRFGRCGEIDRPDRPERSARVNHPGRPARLSRLDTFDRVDRFHRSARVDELGGCDELGRCGRNAESPPRDRHQHPRDGP